MTPALIGRDHPAGVLRAEIGRATDSHGGLVLVAGEAGIGKTTLVTAVALEARQRGALVLGGSCWEGSAPGYWPWVQVVRGMRRGLGEQEWAKAEEAAGGRLAVLLGEAAGDDEAKDAFSVYDAVTTALVTVSQDRPVVVVLDDLHWADTASLRLLEFAAQHAWFERLLLIGTYRDVEVEAPGHPLQQLILPLVARATTAVTLTGLDRDDVGALLALTTGREPEPALVDEVHSRTGGNPFFVEQTARLWHGGSPVSTIAPGVREAVRRRLSMLPKPVGDLLVTASVLGREFHRQVLAAATSAPVPHVDRLLDRAVSARLVVTRGGGRFAFAHDLVRETLYESLEEADAARLHGAVVRALDTAPALSEKIVPADLARHAHLAGGTVDRGHRIDLLLAAARDASSRLAVDEAVGHFRRALEVAETSGEGDPRRAVLISLDLAGELRHHGMEEEARRYFDRAVTPARELGDPELLTRVALTLHQQQDMPGHGSQAGELLHEAYRALFGEEEGDGSAGSGGRGGPGSNEMERIAQDLAVRATDLARRDDDDEALAFSLWARHDTIWGLGTSDERLALTTEMSTVARRTQNLDMEVHAAAMRWVTLLEMGDPRYLGQLRTYAGVAERTGKRRYELGKTLDLGIVAALNGDFDQAEKWYTDTLEAVPDQAAYGYLTSHLRWALHMTRGRYDEADAVTRGLDGVDYFYPLLLDGISAIERGDTARALRLLREVSDRPEPVSRVFAPLRFRLLAHTAAASGDPALIAEARGALGAHSGRWLVALYGCDISGPVDFWLGLLDAAEERWDAAVASFTAARDSADRLQAKPWSLRAGLALADALRARGGAGDAAAEAALRARAAPAARTMGLRHLERRAPGVEVAADEPGSAGSPDPPAPDTRRGPWVRGPWGDGAGPRGPGRPDGGRTEAEAGPAGSARAAAARPVPSGAEFRRDGAVWALAFEGRAVHVPDAKGLRDLHTLVSHPGTDFPAVRLLSPDGGETAAAAHALGGDPVLDERAKAEYRRRLDQLDQEIDRAGERGDDARAAAYDRERQALLDELRTAAGLGGRTRRLGDEAERARKTVTARIRDTLRKLDALHPELAAHLRKSVTTGATCAYRPDGTEDDTSAALTWRL
ncbi:AAA family ATPase [Streptomyces sp. NBC_01725]|uniref:ATP-binding protein n=1 Tax=Streptomyces sp. NBC_01725 TaxID=2975923 RepID=UPI002E2B0729|nr:AAA family ATPase [Streptomyces sp. NBC_01725]